MLITVLHMLRDLVLAGMIMALVGLALLSLLTADRWAFRRHHGQAALDRFDAECSAADEALDRAARVIPIDAGHRRLVARPRTYPKAARIRQREHGGAA